MDREEKISLVLSGGGARGAFQIGVWKALRELGMDKSITNVFGTSVGAINGAAIVQGDFELATKIWENIDYSKVFSDVNLSMAERRSRKYYYSFAKALIRDRGLNVEPLKEMLRDMLDEELLRSSPVDFGLVVYDLSNRRTKYLKKSQIPKGKLIEYIIASATFPLFQPHRIEDQVFMDGGIADNRPLQFLTREENVSRVLCVDVTIARHFWPNKKVNRNIEVEYLRPSRLLGSPLAFRNTRIRRNLELGFTDALRRLQSSENAVKITGS
jgi:NTE family protein